MATAVKATDIPSAILVRLRDDITTKAPGRKLLIRTHDGTPHATPHWPLPDITNIELSQLATQISDQLISDPTSVFSAARDASGIGTYALPTRRLSVLRRASSEPTSPPS